MMQDEDSAAEEEQKRKTIQRYPTLANLDEPDMYAGFAALQMDPQEKTRVHEIKIWLSHNGFTDENDIRCFGAVVETPIHVAVRHNEYRMVKRLLWAGANADFTDHKNRTALDLAIYLDQQGQNRKEIISFLMKGGVSGSCDSLDTIQKNGVVQNYLKRHGFDSVNSKKIHKRLLRRDAIEYPLHHAVKLQRSELVEALIWAGADPHCVNHKGESPLSIAKSKPDGNIIRLLAVH
jgi:ankyrin repeat protein